MAIPAGEEVLAVSFYEGVLGLPRVDKPAELVGRGGCWFRSGSVELHLGVEDPFIPAKKAHPAFLVADLDSVIQRLEGAGYSTSRDDAFPGYDRFYSNDPFGNRIEFLSPSQQ
jgi:catechol 2,3-dioxygenase-like lactoylglutathione lyase family enzyme